MRTRKGRRRRRWSRRDFLLLLSVLVFLYLIQLTIFVTFEQAEKFFHGFLSSHTSLPFLFSLNFSSRRKNDLNWQWMGTEPFRLFLLLFFISSSSPYNHDQHPHRRTILLSALYNHSVYSSIHFALEQVNSYFDIFRIPRQFSLNETEGIIHVSLHSCHPPSIWSFLSVCLVWCRHRCKNLLRYVQSIHFIVKCSTYRCLSKRSQLYLGNSKTFSSTCCKSSRELNKPSFCSFSSSFRSHLPIVIFPYQRKIVIRISIILFHRIMLIIWCANNYYNISIGHDLVWFINMVRNTLWLVNCFFFQSN